MTATERSKTRPQLLLAGQGGGAWGCFPTGALLEYFEQKDQPYDGGFGVSVSALILAKLMATDDGRIPGFEQQRQNARELAEVFLGLPGDRGVFIPWRRKKFPAWVLSDPLKLLPVARELRHVLVALLEGKPSVYNTAPLVKLVGKTLRDKKWHESIRVGVVHLDTGTFEEISLGTSDKPLDAIIASTAIPIAFPPVAGMVDGGVMDMTPLKGVFRRFRELRAKEPGRPQELHVYRCSPFPDHRSTEKKYQTLPDVVWRTLDVMLDNTDEEDFANAVFTNRLADLTSQVMESSDEKLKARFAAWREKYGKVQIYVISPTREDMAQMPATSRRFDPAKIRTGLARGRAAMKKFLADKESYRLERLFDSRL